MTYAFDFFFHGHFRQSAAWARLVQTVEDSPWHREASVALHTEMVLQQYDTRFAPFRSDAQNLIAKFALLFHDVGKPAAEETLEKKDGSGTYRRYAGHEQDSAVAFMEEYVRNENLRAVLSPTHARIVRWIIEHHLPYGLKDVTKRRALKTAINATMTGIEETFYDCLRSDAAGRISDNHSEKLQNVEAWINEFKTVEPFEIKPSSEAKAYVLVGPSGSGKSTWTAAHRKDSDPVVSMDTMKLEFFEKQTSQTRDQFKDDGAFYEAAWQYATIDHDAAFRKFAANRVQELMANAAKTGSNIFFDIVNSSRKARQPWIDLARRYGFIIVGVEFWNTFETLVKRQSTRPDKCVPAKAVRQQMEATTCMWLGYECEDIVLAVGE